MAAFPDHFPIAALDIDASALPALASSPDVLRVGQTVAVLDTGVDSAHPFLGRDHVRASTPVSG